MIANKKATKGKKCVTSFSSKNLLRKPTKKIKKIKKIKGRRWWNRFIFINFFDKLIYEVENILTI